MVGDVIGSYLALLGTMLAGLVVLLIIFVIAMGQGATHGRSVSTILGAGSGVAVIILGLGTMALAAALLAPVLVVAVTVVVLAAMGYTAWRLLRRAQLPSGQ